MARITDRRHDTSVSAVRPGHFWGDVGTGGKVIGVAGFDLPEDVDPTAGDMIRFNGTEWEYVSVDDVAPPGADGLSGSLTGSTGGGSGAPGLDGIDGLQGLRGLTGADGGQGIPGVDGLDGMRGPIGALAEQDHGTVGASENIDCSTKDIHRIVLGANCTLTVSGTAASPVPTLIRVRLIQDSTGSRTVTWWAGITWKAGVAPTLSTAANAVDAFDLEYDSINAVWYGVVVGTVTGPQGVQGEPGMDGLTGPVGLQGIPGIDGLDGLRGLQGATGATGATGAAGGAIVQIGSVAVTGSDAATIDFSSISGSYNHLMIILVGRLDTAATEDFFNIKFNNDGGTNYVRELLDASHTSVGAGDSGSPSAPGTSSFVGYLPANSATAGRAGTAEILIPDYATTNWHKTWRGIGGYVNSAAASGNRLGSSRGTWASTAAINQVTLICNGTQKFKVGTVAYLYGLT